MINTNIVVNKSQNSQYVNIQNGSSKSFVTIKASNNKYNTFLSSATFTPSADGFVEYLVIGGGGGGGDISGGGGGGGGNPTSPIFGCTDPRASNYDASATYNDGSCTYAPTNVYNTQNLVVEIGIQSNPQDGIVLVDGVIQNVKTTPTQLTFNQKELLTPKQITLQKSGVESSDVYKVYTLKKENRKQIPVEIPFDDVVGYTFEQDPQNPNAVIRKREERPKVYESLVYFTYYQLIVEKLIDEHHELQKRGYIVEYHYDDMDTKNKKKTRKKKKYVQ